MKPNWFQQQQQAQQQRYQQMQMGAAWAEQHKEKGEVLQPKPEKKHFSAFTKFLFVVEIGLVIVFLFAGFNIGFVHLKFIPFGLIFYGSILLGIYLIFKIFRR